MVRHFLIAIGCTIPLDRQFAPTGQDFHRFHLIYEDLQQACRLALELDPVPDGYQELNLLSLEGHGKYRATKARRVLGWEPAERWEDYWRREQ